MPVKTYEIYFAYNDGRIEYVKRKARDEIKALHDARQEFPDAWVDAVSTQTARRQQKRNARFGNAVFPRNRCRPGGYLFRHKGKKKRGRRNYPERGYGYPRPSWITFTESQTAPVRTFLNNWLTHVVNEGGIRDVSTAA